MAGGIERLISMDTSVDMIGRSKRLTAMDGMTGEEAKSSTLENMQIIADEEYLPFQAGWDSLSFSFFHVSFCVLCLHLGSLKKSIIILVRELLYILLQYRPKSLALLGLPSRWSIQRKQVLMGRVLVELLKVNTISLYAGESLSWDKSQLMYSFTFCGTLLWTKLSRGVLATRLWKLKFYCAVSDCKSLLFWGGISLH